MIVDGGVEGVFVTGGFIVTEWVDAVTEEAKDVSDSSGEGVMVEKIEKLSESFRVGVMAE